MTGSSYQWLAVANLPAQYLWRIFSRIVLFVQQYVELNGEKDLA